MNTHRSIGIVLGMAWLLAAAETHAQDRALRAGRPAAPSKLIPGKPKRAPRSAQTPRPEPAAPMVAPDEVSPYASALEPTEAPFATPPTSDVVERSPSDGDVTAPTDDAIDRTLVGYGTWTDDSTYGRVWQPAPECVGSGFKPYVTGGRWKLDGERWKWASDYPWGASTFHYGNWVWRDGKGWAWVPGKTYAPAWVVWRLGEPGDDHVGWAPMPPPRPTNSTAPEPPLAFHFVPVKHLFSKQLESHLVTDPNLGRDLIARTRLFKTTNETEPSTATAPTPTLTDARIRAIRVVTTEPKAALTAPTTSVSPSPKSGTGYRCRMVTGSPPVWRCAWE
jgi:hypothetical protein